MIGIFFSPNLGKKSQLSLGMGPYFGPRDTRKKSLLACDASALGSIKVEIGKKNEVVCGVLTVYNS